MDQKKANHASEYSAAHWSSSLRKRLMDRNVSCERGESFLLLTVRTVDDVLLDKAERRSGALMDGGLTGQQEQTGLSHL